MHKEYIHTFKINRIKVIFQSFGYSSTFVMHNFTIRYWKNVPHFRNMFIFPQHESFQLQHFFKNAKLLHFLQVRLFKVLNKRV